MKKVLTTLMLVLLLVAGCGQGAESTPTPTPTSQSTQTPTVSGVTYYVSPSGDDASPGTITDPWATIQHAAEVLVAGDTLFIRGGTYNESIEVANSGDATYGHIVLSAYPGEQPIIDGTGSEASNGLIMSGKSYIRLLGLEIRNWSGNAVWLEYCDHIEISDCEVAHAFYGIGLLAIHDFELNRVTIHHFDLYGFDASAEGSNVCYNGVLNDCIAHTGRDPQQNVDGFALGHGDQHHFTLNRCITHDVFDGFDSGADNTDVTFNRCLAYDNWNTGFKVWGHTQMANCVCYHNGETNVELDWSGTPKTATLQNCTFVDAGTFNIWVENSQDTLYMYNCIVAGGDNIGLAFEQMGVAGYQGDYNIFHNDDAERAIEVGYEDEFSLSEVSAGQWAAYGGQDTHSLAVTDVGTLFGSLSAWNLHLCPGSVAIDSGMAQGAPQEDHDGNARPQGAGYDIGAYEYGQ